MKTNRLILILLAVSLAVIPGCANQPTRTADGKIIVEPSAASIAAMDTKDAVTQALQAYTDIRDGNANFAWAIAKGADAYRTGNALVRDFKDVVKAWGGNTGDSQKLADRLKRIFAIKKVDSQQQQAALVSAAVPVAVASSGNP